MVRQEKNYTDHCGKSMTVGEKIQAIRKEKGLSQKELAKKNWIGRDNHSTV